MDLDSLPSLTRQIAQLPSGSEHHQETLNQIYDSVARADASALGKHFTEDCELLICGWPDMNGRWHGRKNVVAAILRNFSRITEQVPVMDVAIHLGDVSAFRMHETGKVDGIPYAVRGVMWFTFTGNQIVRIEEFMDTQ